MTNVRQLLTLTAGLLALAGCPTTPPADACAPNPCTAGDRTVCTVVDGLASCSCRAGFEDVGGACVQPGPCAANPCTAAHRTVCLEQGATAVCACDDGYRDDGQGACVPVQSCSPVNPCAQPNKSTCTEAQGAVVCSCDVGYRDDGAGGCVSVNPCAVNPCTQPNRGVCLPVGDTAVCQCDSGYVDQAGQCVKAATCTPNPCTLPNQNQCTETPGGVTCGCNPGFRPDGAGQCVAVVACRPNPCTQPNRSVCTDVGGTAVCSCDVGYEDRLGTCVQSDPCQPNPCTQPHQGVCSTGADAGVSCACDPGYQPGSNGCEPIPPPTCTGQHATGDSYEPDECPALAKDILSGVPQPHTVDPVGDVDFVKFSVDAGAVVRLEEPSSFSASVTLYDTDGVTALQTASGPDRILRKLPNAGTYFLRVRAASSSATGNTTIAFDDLGFDDQADTETGANTLMPSTMGAVLAGAFEYPADWDVLAVPVQAGHVYRFEETSSADVYVRLTSGSGTIVGATDSPELISWKAPADLTVYFAVRLYSSGATGTWAMRVTDLGLDDQADTETGSNTLTPSTMGTALTGAFEFTGDWDVLAVPVQAGHVYRFEETSSADVYVRLTSGSGTIVPATDSPELISWKAPADLTVYFAVRLYSSGATGTWALRVTDLGLDDQADTETGASTLNPSTMGTALTGAFEFTGDWDVLAVPVQAGHVYRFEETSSADVYVRLTSGSGTIVPATDSPELISWKAPADLTVFFAVRLYSSGATGTWALRVNDLGFDDQADSEVGANVVTPTTMGTVLNGAFEFTGDWDVVAVPVQANVIYRFEETSSTDVYVRLTSGAATLVATQDSPEAFQWRATADGTLYFGIRHYSSGATGPWTMKVTEVGLDDHGDARASATMLMLGAAATPGALQFIGDVDYFGFTAAAGSLAFQVVTTGASVDVQVQNASGGVVASGTGPGTLTFSVPSAGDYFIRVSRSALVSYTVRVSN